MSLAEAAGTGLALVTTGVLLCKIKTRASDHSDYAAYSVTVQVRVKNTCVAHFHVWPTPPCCLVTFSSLSWCRYGEVCDMSKYMWDEPLI